MFRPMENDARWRLKERRNNGPWSGNLNFCRRIEWFPPHMTKQQRMFAKRFSRLHYLACHAPEPVQRKWRSAYNNFMNRHFAQKGNASMRFLNKYTCHAWL